ncbi:MAG TPA: hypothetical protein VHU91_03200 [Mycobacteriales bacterium]|jgi:capsular polysaccharide biosynthesis protein|nr:hypothetical protein [Mycobacteriales bacterium]
MKSRWAPAFLVAALMVCTVGTAALYASSQSDVYSSRAVVALTPRSAAGLGATNLRLAVTRYTTLLSSDETLREVSDTTGLSSKTLSKATKVTVPPNTVTINITVTLTRGDQAAAAANAIASAGLRYSRGDELVSTDLVAPGVTPTSPSGPNRRLIMLGGIGTALLVGAVAMVALGFFRNSATLSGALPRQILALR